MKLLIYTLLFLFFFQYLCMCNKNLASYKNELENDKNRKTQIPTETSTGNSKFFPFAVQNFGTLGQTKRLTNKQRNHKFHYGHIR